MSTFDDREKAFEKQFVVKEELAFKINARTCRLFGHWAADRLGKTGAEAEAYAKSVVLADFEESGNADVIRKVLADLEAAGIPITEADVQSRWNTAHAEATRQVQG